MNAHLLYTAILLCALVGISAGPPQHKETLPVIELREGGDLMPLPHPWTMRIYADGLIQLKNGEKRHATATEVKQLLTRLEKFGFFKWTTAGLQEQLRKAGELAQTLEGGSGVVTLVAVHDGKSHEVTVHHPEEYTHTTVRDVQWFRSAVQMVQDFVKQHAHATH